MAPPRGSNVGVRGSVVGGEVEVCVRHVSDPDEVIVFVHQLGDLRDVKEAVATAIRRPEVLEKGEIVVCLPSGVVVPCPDEQKLGSRRMLRLAGVPLSEPPPDKATNLEDLDPYDPEGIIGSPRSLHACELEGITAIDVIYTPLEVYLEEEVPEYIAQLRHDFFDALRLDFLAAAQATRRTLLDEANSPSKAIVTTKAAGTGGGWSGSMAPSSYPAMESFLKEQRGFCNAEVSSNLRGKPTEPQGLHYGKSDRGGGGRFGQGPPHPPGLTRHAALQAQDDAVSDLEEDDMAYDASSKVNRLLGRLKRMPGSRHTVKNEELLRCEDQILKTKSEVVVQRRRNSLALEQQHDDEMVLVERRADIEDSQIRSTDAELDYQNYLREGMDSRARTNSGPWVGVAARNVAPAIVHAEHCSRVRHIQHERQLVREHARVDDKEQRMHHDQVRAQKMKERTDHVRVKFARDWTEQRIAWTAANTRTAGKQRQWENKTFARLKQVQALRSQEVDRKEKYGEYRRELKELRAAFRLMTTQRQGRREDVRRALVSRELSRMAEEADLHHAKRVFSPQPSLSGSLSRLGSHHLSADRRSRVTPFTLPRKSLAVAGSQSMRASVSSPALLAGAQAGLKV